MGKKTIRIVRKGKEAPEEDDQNSPAPAEEIVESDELDEVPAEESVDEEEELEEEELEEEELEEEEPKLKLARHSAPSASHEWGEKDQTVSPVGERFQKGRGTVNRGTLKKMRARTAASRTRLKKASKPPEEEEAPEPEPEAPKTSVRTRSRSGKVTGARSRRSKRSRTSSTTGSRKRGRRRGKKGKRESSNAPAIIGLSLLAILMAIVGIVGSYVVRGPRMGTMGVVNGEVTILRPTAGAEPYLAEIGMRLGQDFIITTETNSDAFILYPDDGVMHIEGGTRIKMGRVKKSSMEYLAKWVDVLDGPPTNKITMEIPRQEPGMPLELRTVNSTIWIDDDNLLLTSSFDVDRIDMTEGEVQILRKFDKQKGKVKAGYFVLVSENLPMDPVHRSGDTTVESFAFISPEGDSPIEGYEVLKSQVILYPGDLEIEPAVLARTEPEVVGSVKFTLDGTDVVVIDNEPPYIFRGSADAPDGAPWQMAKGAKYRLHAVSYSKKDGVGKPSRPRSVEINVVSLD